jgi:hypothetical protein
MVPSLHTSQILVRLAHQPVQTLIKVFQLHSGKIVALVSTAVSSRALVFQKPPSFGVSPSEVQDVKSTDSEHLPRSKPSSAVSFL